MVEKEIEYKGYIIRIVPQENQGDLKTTFFRVFKDEEDTEFTVWEKISGTSYRGTESLKEIFELLEKEGLVKVKEIIDNENYTKAQQFVFWTGN